MTLGLGGEAEAAGHTGFPLTMQHKPGDTTIPSRSERVVTASFNDADFALARRCRPSRRGRLHRVVSHRPRAGSGDALVAAGAALLFGLAEETNYFLLEPIDPRVGLFVSLGFDMPAHDGEISGEQLASALESR